MKRHFSDTIWLTVQFTEERQDKYFPLSNSFSGTFHMAFCNCSIHVFSVFSIKHDFIQVINHDTKITITYFSREYIA